MRAVQKHRNQFTMWPLLLPAMLAMILTAYQSAYALTDYVFISVNGDTSVNAMTQGDFIGFGCNCAVGAEVQFELWYDINHNDVIDSSTDMNIVVFRAQDGQPLNDEGLPDINPVADGWYITPELLIGLAPGTYVIRLMDLSDQTFADLSIVTYAMPTPPNKFCGHISIPGYPAPNINLSNIWIQAELQEAGGMQMWGAMTDNMGYFEICINDSGTGLEFEISPMDIPGYLTPPSQELTASGAIYGVDFNYDTPSDSLYGQIKDENDNLILAPVNVYCRPIFSGASTKNVDAVNGNYVIYFGSSERGLWYAGLSRENLVPTYLVPSGFGFDNDTNSSINYDFICLTADTVLYARITENGNNPQHRYLIEATSNLLSSNTYELSDTGINNLLTLHISSQDTNNWSLNVVTGDYRYPVPEGYILEGGQSNNHHPGDTVDLNFIHGVGITDTVKFDIGDQTVSWYEIWIGIFGGSSNYGGNPNDNGVFTIYADTGTYSMVCFHNNYLSIPNFRTIHLTGDTTGGLGFTLNKKHCRIMGTLVNAILPIPYDATVVAHTGDGNNGYVSSASVDRNTGTFELDVCDGTWIIDPPFLPNRIQPTAPVVLVSEIPDTLKTLDIVYTVLGIDNADQLPANFALLQNYPNPFNSSTVIDFVIPTQTHVTLDIVNILGQTIRTLVNNDEPAGNYRAIWDGMDDHGQMAASGIYLYRIKAGDYNQTRKMILVK
jgi:hypothetical protein